MGLEILTLGSSKTYTRESLLGLGSLKGAPCTIKSITEVDGGQKVTFEWIGTSGTKQTSEMTVKNGVSVTGISDKGNGTFTLILSDGSESEPIHTVKGDTSNVQLDETLTDNTKAAPAGMVGEMKKEISSLSEEIANLSGGAPTPVSVVTDMTDTAKIYLYTGAEDGYIAGNWYYYDGTAWVSGGKYGETNTTEATSIEPKEDDIPKVFLTGDEYGNMNATKNEVNMEMEYISKTLKFHSYILIKWQGSSSITNGYPKHNFTVKMFEDEARETKKKLLFKDWKFEKNKYVWKANYIDVSHARNIVCARLWSEVVASRSDYNTLPEELRTSPNNGAIDGFPIKVYVNGTYDGIYTWNIGKDDWMWNMDENNPNHLMICAEQNVVGENPCNFNKTITAFNDGNWSVEVGTPSTDLVTSFNNLITCVKDTDDETFKSTIGNYLDIQSAIDYYAFHYAICGLDGLGKNVLMGTFDGVKWIIGSYDMDSVLGLYWNGSLFVSPEYACPEDYQAKYSLLWQRIEKVFKEELQTRYFELRKSVLSFSNICTHFERFMDSIGTDLYKDDSTLYPRTLSNTNNITQIRNFVRDRLVYVDNEIANLGQTTYTITKNLTGATIDNTATVVTEGSSYIATIMADAGSEINSVVVTMGGTDVTSTVYADGVITISSVTGDIVITVVAQSGISDEGLVYSLPSSTTFDATNVVDTGWKLAENKSFTYAFTLDECEVPTDADTIVCDAGGWKGVVRLDTSGTLRMHGFAWTPVIPFGSIGSLNTKGVHKCVAIYNAETSQFTAKMSKDGVDVSDTQWGTQAVSYNAWATTLKLGEAIIDGANERQGFTGTLSDFRVYERAFTESEINTYLGI